MEPRPSTGHPAVSIPRGALGALFYHVTSAVAVVDSGWVIRRWNPAAERLLGFVEEELIGQPISVIFASNPEFDQCRFALEHQRDLGAEDGGSPVRTRIRSQAGLHLAAACRLISLNDTDEFGSSRALLIEEVAATGLDTTAEALLRQMQVLAETASAIMADRESDRVAQSLTDLLKELIKADFTALARTQRQPDGSFAVTGFSYNAPRHLFPERFPRAIGILELALKTGKIIRLDDIRGHPQGVGIPVKHPPIGALLAAPLVLDGEVHGELLAANRTDRPAFTDLDEILMAHLATLARAALDNARLQSEITAKADQLERLDEQRRSVIAAIAHDLRTPAATVLGYAELVVDPQLPEEKRHLILDRLRAQTRQMTRLVDDLSTLANLDTQQLSVTVGPIDARAVMEQLIADYEVRYRERQFALLGPSPCFLLADEQRLRQILTNLMDNALKYSAPSSTIELGLAPDSASVAITVRDQGSGIAADELPHIFEPFYRTARSRGAAPGIGLGLTIVKGLAEAMNGDVTADSEPGRGSCFTVRLPSPT